MKTDLYTKSMLTIIAICLVLVVVKDIEILPKAYANQPTTPQNYGLVPLNSDGTIDVNVKTFSSESKIQVEMEDQINVNVKRVGGRKVYGGTLNVDVK